jgi:hypothetical protein
MTMWRRPECSAPSAIATTGPLTADQLRRLVDGFADAARTIAEAEPVDKAELYVALGVSVTCDPTSRSVTASVRPDRCSDLCVGGGT